MNDRPPIREAGANSLGRGYLFPLIGCALLLGATVGCFASVARWWGAERTEGTVVALEPRSSEDGVAYYPVVAYTVGGQRFRCKGSFGFSPPMFRVGERVGVLYRADRPDEAVIDTFLQRWGAWAFLAVVGLLFVFVSWAMRLPERAGAAAPKPPTGPSEPTFHEEMGVRGYVLGSLGCLGAGLTVFVAVAGLFPWIMGHAQWWVWFVAAFCGLTLVYFAATYASLLVRGGTYRVVVQDGRLRVDSPHRTLGSSFDVPLTSVQRLVIWKVSEGADRYEVHACPGQVYELNSACARRLFEAIRQFHPEIPVESRDE
jgi:uncharacterized membrane protein